MSFDEKLDSRLIEEKTTDGCIDFHKHISKVREEASSWLEGNEKNGVKHSKRLEGYLDRLIPDKFKKKLKPAEVFILLYAVCLHDIGYRNEQGEIESRDHPLRSKKYILKDPKKYLFDLFPSMKKGEAPLAAQAVAEICYGHAHESVCPLKNISNYFGDFCLCKDPLNLRRLAALLRLADEMDQAYIRLGHLRHCISLPAISPGIVRMHWKGDQNVGKALGDLVQGINETLEPVNDLLSEWDFPKTTVVLDPLVKKSPPPPQEPIGYKESIPEHYIPSRCHDEKGDNQGLLHDYVLEWLNDPKRKLLAVLGDYGIGKTSFCYKFACDMTGSVYVPVVVELKAVMAEGWREVIQKEVRSRAGDSTQSPVLILDGFDELSLTFDKETVLKEIENLSKTTQEYKKVILTSSTKFFRSEEDEKETIVRKDFHERGPRSMPFPRFERIYISLFDDEQIRRYLDLCLGEKEAEKFWNETVKKVFDVKGLARRPILIELIVNDLDAVQNIAEKSSVTTTSIIYDSSTLAGDLNNDSRLDLTDAIIALKASTISLPVHKEADVKDDGKVGLGEAIDIPQEIGGVAGISVGFNYVPEYGSNGYLKGEVAGAADPDSYFVALYIKVGDNWWTKPYYNSPLTAVKQDGTWTCNITTGGYDRYASKIAAYLLPAGVEPPICATCYELPEIPEAVGFARAERGPETRRISFAGYEWRVKRTDFPCGPGPNYFSDRPEDVWANEEEFHLTISERNGKWYCTEVILDASLGYGAYMFRTRGRVDIIDPIMVFALFTWDGGASYQSYREIDIEFARWGNSDEYTNAQYVIQPCSQCPGCDDSCTRFRADLTDQNNELTHYLVWQPGSVEFRTYYGEYIDILPPASALAHQWTFSGEHVPQPGNENVRFNFWLHNGQAPAGGQGSEVVITSFAWQKEQIGWPEP